MAARTVRRRPESERWSYDGLMGVRLSFASNLSDGRDPPGAVATSSTGELEILEKMAQTPREV